MNGCQISSQLGWRIGRSREANKLRVMLVALRPALQNLLGQQRLTPKRNQPL
jgi:hypothetical protein